MNNVCSSCGVELKSSIEEFGDIRSPVCQSCWLSGVIQEDEEHSRLSELKEELESIEDEIEGYEDEISGLESRRNRIEMQIRQLEKPALKRPVVGIAELVR